MTVRFDRRRAIWASIQVAGAALAGWLPGRAWAQAPAPAVERVPAALARVCAAAFDADAVGAACAQALREGATAAALVDALLGRPEAAPRRIAERDEQALARVLHQQIQKDFEAGRLVYVRKWGLAVTEARLFALGYLLRAGRTAL